MTLEDCMEILKAAIDGKVIQRRDSDEEWCNIPKNHIFNFQCGEHRVKPIDIWINDYPESSYIQYVYSTEAAARSAAHKTCTGQSRYVKA